MYWDDLQPRSLVPTGRKIILNTYEPATDFLAEIAVFRNDCGCSGNLQCVVIGHRDLCPFFYIGATSLVWNFDVQNRVLMFGHSTNKGNYGLIYTQRE